ncbi:putative Late nodulin [Medicago truncatula]|uniref:Defensin n=1 Tax=Medicago truncatula TaxID=3880 RepID=G7KJN4_MEDTR|nr:Defensin [Medicago truncatula]RHN52439.1 putative Late nodulin [Medicago truncatula]
MAQLIIFVYALMVFLSIFLVESYKTKTPCKSLNDCPKAIKPIFVKCLGNICQYSIGRI